MKFRDSASFGKRQEYSVVAELLKRDFDVYMTLVDDQGIDCIIRLDSKKYIDVQIKARSSKAKQWNYFAGMKISIRKNLYFIFYTEKNNSFWIIPSMKLPNLGTVNKGGKHKGKIHLRLPKTDRASKAKVFDIYKNENGYKLLKKFK